jgi:hypothetical protein
MTAALRDFLFMVLNTTNIHDHIYNIRKEKRKMLADSKKFRNSFSSSSALLYSNSIYVYIERNMEIC